MTGQTGARAGQTVLGRYRLLRFLGSGGMGEVYEAEHVTVGKRVAIKCLWPSYWQDAEHVERFEREARVASIVRSPHVVDVLDAGTLEDGAPFLTMELLEGTTLATELATAGRMSVDRALSILRQLATGLAATHAAGIIHRDLKPENVFLVADRDRELVKILDFGVSKFRRDASAQDLTRTGTAIGTPSYMSPEQSEGMRDVDVRADVWSLGVILFRMLTGELPFVAENYPRLLIKIVGDDPAPRARSLAPEISRDLDAIIARCLEKAPAGRFASMTELLSALPGEPKTSPSITRPERAAPSPAPRSEREDSATRPTGSGSAPATHAPTQLARPKSVYPPSRESASAALLPFDEVVLSENGRQQRVTAQAFFSLPLSVRIRHVIARTAVFLKQGREVDRQEALARMRERYAS
jgi:serine/threonine-protein kinase